MRFVSKVAIHLSQVRSALALRRAAYLVRKSQAAFRRGRSRSAARFASQARWWIDLAEAGGTRDDDVRPLTAVAFAQAWS